MCFSDQMLWTEFCGKEQQKKHLIWETWSVQWVCVWASVIWCCHSLFLLQNGNISHDTQHAYFEIFFSPTTFFCPLCITICCETAWEHNEQKWQVKLVQKGFSWPEIMTQSFLKPWWSVITKAHIFGTFNSSQHRLITVMALSHVTPSKYLILLCALHNYCKHTCTSWSNEHRWVLCV